MPTTNKSIVQIALGTLNGLPTLFAVCNDGSLWSKPLIPDGAQPWTKTAGPAE